MRACVACVCILFDVNSFSSSSLDENSLNNNFVLSKHLFDFMEF